MGTNSITGDSISSGHVSPEYRAQYDGIFRKPKGIELDAATKDQVAAVMLQQGTEAQVQEALEYCAITLPILPEGISLSSVQIAWSAPSPPNARCSYDHIKADTPFGTFLLTWKSWKEYPAYGFDETPWGEVAYGNWNTIEAATAWAEREMYRRVMLCLSK